MKELFKVECFHIRSFFSSSEISAFDFVLKSNRLAAFWRFSFLTNDAFQHILFFRAVPFLDFGTVPSLKAKTDCSSFVVPFDEMRTCLDAL